ncbi:MAG: hypothetical protein HYT62_00970, partial [Candidatus Yanofskybacteria bacterium]|nr:hypothetical protein [Candidatus Yanofskybacteria bacterium]
MCDFISWIESGVGSDKKVFFLTDADVFSPHGRNTLVGSRDNDYLGHSAIRAFFGNTLDYQVKKEDRNFWVPENYPSEIANRLSSPQTIRETWGKILKQSLQQDDVGYILRNAPKDLVSALIDLFEPAMHKCRPHSIVTWPSYVFTVMSSEMCRVLVDRVLGITYLATQLFLKRTVLTQKQRSVLLNNLRSNVPGCCELLSSSAELTQEESNMFINIILDSGELYEYIRLLTGARERLSANQRKRIFNRILRSADHSLDLFKLSPD